MYKNLKMPMRRIQYGRRRLQNKWQPRNPMNDVIAGAALATGAKAAYDTYQGVKAVYKAATAQRPQNRSIPKSSPNYQSRTVTNNATAMTAASRTINRQGGEIQMYKKNIGRMQKLTVDKLSKISTFKQILRWQNIGPVDKGLDRGAMRLGPLVSANTTITPTVTDTGFNAFIDNISTTADATDPANTNWLRAPYHLYCLNHTNLNGGGPADPALQTFIKLGGADAGTVSFTGLNQTIPGGTAATTWNIEYRSVVDDPKEQHFIQHLWYDISLCLRNARQQKTWYDVWIFRFKDGYLDPHESPSSLLELKDRRAFYQGLAIAGHKHPIFKDPAMHNVKNKITIIKKYRIMMKPQTTDVSAQTDTSPNMKVLRIHVKDGRLYNHHYASEPVTGAAGFEQEGLFVNHNYVEQGPSGANNSSIPRPRARTWMMVRAFDPTLQASAGGDNTLTTNDVDPMYDIVVRVCQQARSL